MEHVLPVINKLQSIVQRCGVSDPIDLPQIVVVGAQSSGKSSVLEAIVGFDFLPRGTGVITRCPIIIQLNKLKTSAENKNTAKWVEFPHTAAKKFESESEIQAEIMAATEKSAGKNMKLSSTALIMKVFSTEVVNLTLVDLPGLTKVPVGDQPANIEGFARTMIHSYISKPNSIILAVHPANTDIATSDALQMARSVDPQGLRTLGVITKLDLMDLGTNALNTLLGRTIPLRRGYIGVVNRSQKDLNAKSTIMQAKLAEKIFFQSHPIYAPYAAKMGSPYLAEILSTMLMEHIHDVLPSIRSNLATQLTDIQKQLSTLGPQLGEGDDSNGVLLHLLISYASAFSDAIEGRPQPSIATKELAGGARISFIFHDKFGRELEKMDPFESLGSDEIRTALRNATGHRTPLFIPEFAFEMLVKRQIRLFLKPSLACVDLVYDELTHLAELAESPELARFHRLRAEISNCTLKLLREHKIPTIEMVQNLIDMEMSYINTWHPDFVGGKQAWAVVALASSEESNASAVNGSDMDMLGSTRVRPGYEGVRQEAWVEKNLLGHQNRLSKERQMFSNEESIRPRPRTHLEYVTQPFHHHSTIPGSDAQQGIAGLAPNTTSIRKESKDAVSKVKASFQNENQELEILRKLLESYVVIVRKRLQDMVPRAIITFLVHKSKDSLQSVLVKKLYKSSTVNELMIESGDITQNRKDMTSIEALLEEALSEMNEIRDAN